jgi:hypothetical protein
MLLQRVVYELFGWEVGGLPSDPAAGCEELGRQVRLEGADGARVYISWAWGRGRPDYFIDYGPDSFFTDPPAAEVDVSGSAVWRPLVGRPITVGHQDTGWQVIEVRAEAAVVYCCSFQSDRVFVMPHLRDGRVIRCT